MRLLAALALTTALTASAQLPKIATDHNRATLNTAHAQSTDMPHLEHRDNRYAFIVDGKPFFLLGAQVDNSSGWPDRLTPLWPIAERMKLNTLEVPVYWEQLEPTRGHFDFTVVDNLIGQARQHHTRLVLLWFGTWKNGKMHYVPSWVKSDTTTYPRMFTRAGKPIDVLSPNAPANLDADRTAFVALMHHIRETRDGQLYQSRFGERQRGSGLYADSIANLFKVSCRKLGLQPGEWSESEARTFKRPERPQPQLSLF